MFGLAFSCLGDALLIWPQYFVHGMAAFGVAQIMYTSAFGFTPLNAALGATLYSLCMIGSYKTLNDVVITKFIFMIYFLVDFLNDFVLFVKFKCFFPQSL